MQIETLKKEEMESVRILAETNLKISEAKVILSGLETSKDEFLAEREHEAIEIIKTTLNRSEGMLKDIGKNYDQLKEIKGLITNIVDFAEKFCADIVSIKKELEQGSENAIKTIRSWRTDLEKREEEIKKSLSSIETEKKKLEEGFTALRKARKQLDSDQKALALAYKEIEQKNHVS